MNLHHSYDDMVGGFQKRQQPARSKSREDQARGRKFNKPVRREKHVG